MDIAPINLPLVQPQVYTAAAPAPGAVGDAGGAKAVDPYQTAVYPASVRRVDSDTWLYYFDEMIVGTASVVGSAWSGNGAATSFLRHIVPKTEHLSR